MLFIIAAIFFIWLNQVLIIQVLDAFDVKSTTGAHVGGMIGYAILIPAELFLIL